MQSRNWESRKQKSAKIKAMTDDRSQEKTNIQHSTSNIELPNKSKTESETETTRPRDQLRTLNSEQGRAKAGLHHRQHGFLLPADLTDLLAL